MELATHGAYGFESNPDMDLLAKDVKYFDKSSKCDYFFVPKSQVGQGFNFQLSFKI